MSRPFPKAVVLSLRRQVAGGKRPSALARQLHVSSERIWRAVEGQTHPDVGGPLTQRPKRRNGKRRWCTRCRLRQNEFAYASNSECGVCVKCVRPDDDFPVVGGPRVDLEKRRAERRAELRAQIEVLMRTPLTGTVLSEQDREQVRLDVVRSMRASAYDGSELIDLGGE